MTRRRYINVKTPRVMPWRSEAPEPLPENKNKQKIKSWVKALKREC